MCGFERVDACMRAKVESNWVNIFYWFSLVVCFVINQVISALESETVFSGATADVGQLSALSLCLEADAKTSADAAASTGMLVI